MEYPAQPAAAYCTSGDLQRDSPSQTKMRQPRRMDAALLSGSARMADAFFVYCATAYLLPDMPPMPCWPDMPLMPCWPDIPLMPCWPDMPLMPS